MFHERLALRDPGRHVRHRSLDIQKHHGAGGPMASGAAGGSGAGDGREDVRGGTLSQVMPDREMSDQAPLPTHCVVYDGCIEVWVRLS